MTRWVVFLVVGALLAWWGIDAECVATERTGRVIDATWIEGPYGEPLPGPGVVPVARCTQTDQKLGARAVAGGAIALVLSLLGWWAQPARGVPGHMGWGAYVMGRMKRDAPLI